MSQERPLWSWHPINELFIKANFYKQQIPQDVLYYLFLKNPSSIHIFNNISFPLPPDLPPPHTTTLYLSHSLNLTYKAFTSCQGIQPGWWIV